MKDNGPKEIRIRGPKLTTEERADAIYEWIDCYARVPVPSQVSDLATLEKQTWWQEFKGGEFRATKAVFDKLAGLGIVIHKKSSSNCHWLEGEETADGFNVLKSYAAPPQLIASPLNLKKWRRDHRLMKVMFQLYLRKTGHIRFVTLPVGPIKLDQLDGEITKLHEHVGWLAHRPWLKQKGLEFVLRKTEVPLIAGGQPGQEEVFLHAHIALRPLKRMGRDKWGKCMGRLRRYWRAKLRRDWHSDYRVHDAGEIEDEERQPSYLFKNPVSTYGENPNDPNDTVLHYAALAGLGSEGTKNLFEALRKKRLVHPLGDFARFIDKLRRRAKEEGMELKLLRRLVGNQLQTKLFKVPKRDPKQRRQAPVQDLVIRTLAGRRLVRNYSGASHLAAPHTKLNKLQPLTPPPRNQLGRNIVTAKLRRRVIDYIRQLGKRQFQTREIELPRLIRQQGKPDEWPQYGHWTLNPVLETIPWLKQAECKTRGTQPGQPTKRRRIGRGEWRRWKVLPKHPKYPKLHKRPRINPDTLPTTKKRYLLGPDDPYAPGFWAAQRAAMQRMARREHYRRRAVARKQTGAAQAPTGAISTQQKAGQPASNLPGK